MKPTHDNIRRTVGELLRDVVLSHGADARSILICQIQRRHAGDSKHKNQHERREKHVTLVAVLMHQVGEGDTSPTEQISALAANSQALTDVIARVYGRDGARAFAQLWEQHTQFFIDYAHADHVHSNAAKHLAQEQLLAYQNDFARLLTTATASATSLPAVTGLLHAHVHDLTSYIDADVAGNDTWRYGTSLCASRPCR